MQTLYTLLYLHLLPLFVLRLYWRARKAPAYAKRIKERFALIPTRKTSACLFWIHAVSVGEVIAAIPVVRALQLRYPDAEFCITTTTPTGSERVISAFDNQILHYYLPYDVPSFMQFFIKAVRPQMLIIMETELWPNMILMCKQQDIPVLLVNGRMSAKSARGYQRFSALTKPMLNNIDLIAAQSPADALRFVQLGASDEKVKVLGSVKFDVCIDASVLARKAALVNALACMQRRIVIFASTHAGEDEQILPIIKKLSQQTPSMLAIVVPRHPERFELVARLAQSQAISYQLLSEGLPCTKSTELIIADTMGDMLALYGMAEIAFIGGSLIHHGGHNFLEAAVWGLPIFSGKSVFNFQAIADAMQEEKALSLVDNAEALEQHLLIWLEHAGVYEDMGKAAKQYMVKNAGVIDKLLVEVQGLLKNS